jgi:hypothetical protein
MERSLNIEDPMDWKRVTKSHLERFGVHWNELSSLRTHIREKYKNLSNDKWRLSSNSRSQLFLHKLMRDIFPNESIEFEYSLNFLKNEEGGHNLYPLQVDIWIPSWNLAIEYQAIT